MIEKGKISAFQMSILMYPAIIATGILIIPSITAQEAGRDLWVSPIFASSLGFLTAYIAIKLHQHYPGKSVIQYSQDILGTFLGKIIGLLYIFFILHSNGIIFREYSEFIIGVFLLDTPPSLILGSMAIVCAFAVRGGLEVIARTAQIFIPIVIFLIVGMAGLIAKDLNPEYILPFLGEGIAPSLKGAKAPAAWFIQIFHISFFLPFLTNRDDGMKWSMITLIFVVLTLVTTNLMALFLFGDYVTGLLYPVMSASRYISAAGFFENLESVVMALWVVGAFVKICVFYYVTVLATAQWLNLSEYKAIALPIGFITVLFAYWSGRTFIELKDFLAMPVPIYLFTFYTVIPILLFVLSLIKKKRKG
ncbi:GerAB/ArcD/ProY family transporter [Texcoconibacillus texcoconensis]|uniref:Spore germination protein KB n=1 Tax=Texcoconibacillus texcoconensis TaxID=1095777 RepID=A0A840QV20_9BACI|nr:endospore germination permease [Texcoconibacillus texcoconensis]MBB5175118.1 spore germination protein KB [Texcoconibacillus texcoconensis]